MATTYYVNTCDRGIFKTSEEAAEACSRCARTKGGCPEGFDEPWQSPFTEDGDTKYALRLFIDGRRSPSNVLTKRQAQNFLIAAEHLASFLRSTYGV